MGEKTGIAWCDSTWNPWIGCTKVSPGCDHCYAEALDARYEWGGGTHWGPGKPRHRTSPQYWQQPLRWNRIARDHGKVHRVFPSLCDPFDNEVPEQWREDLFALIQQTPNLTWLLLTKRIANVNKLVPALGHWENAWIGASIVNQEEADRDIPKLLAVPAAKRFVSYEPALGPVNFWLTGAMPNVPYGTQYRRDLIHQIIVGGESTQGGGKARPFEIEWARSTVKQCRQAGVACFVKQLGSSVAVRNDSMEEWPDEDAFSDAIPDDYEPAYQGEAVCIRLKDRAGADPAEWPEDLRVQEFPA